MVNQLVWQTNTKLYIAVNSLFYYREQWNNFLRSWRALYAADPSLSLQSRPVQTDIAVNLIV